jgi:hypothetical protein
MEVLLEKLFQDVHELNFARPDAMTSKDNIEPARSIREGPGPT